MGCWTESVPGPICSQVLLCLWGKSGGIEGVYVVDGIFLPSIQGSHGSVPAAVYDDSLDPFSFCHVLYPKEVPRLGSCPSCDCAQMGAIMSQGRLSCEERNAVLKRVPALMRRHQHCVHRLL